MRISQSDGRSQLDGHEGIEVHPATSSHNLVSSENEHSQSGHLQAGQSPEFGHATGSSSLAPPQRAY